MRKTFPDYGIGIELNGRKMINYYEREDTIECKCSFYHFIREKVKRKEIFQYNLLLHECPTSNSKRPMMSIVTLNDLDFYRNVGILRGSKRIISFPPPDIHIC